MKSKFSTEIALCCKNKSQVQQLLPDSLGGFDDAYNNIKLFNFINNLTKLIKKCLKDSFEVLGGDAFYHIGNKSLPIRVLFKQHDSSYEVGAGQFIGNMASFKIMVEEIALPKIGDLIEIDRVYYKIFEEPLKNISNLVWEIKAMAVR